MYIYPYSQIRSSRKKNSRIIEVQGIGKVEIMPDQALIRLGVITENENASVAQQENTERINKVLSSLKMLGVKEEEIETYSYTVTPVYQYPTNGEKILTGYEVVNLVTVLTSKINEIGIIIDTVIENGANRIESITYEAANLQPPINESLRLASKQALEKAKVIAQSFKVNLIETPVKVVEVSRAPVPQIQYTSFEEGMVKGLSTVVSPRKLEIISELQISFTYQK
ncbi:SIMPL domain-containing protein [Metabacillus arenae]|uniref:SIMPL domain-containing protein n=1 Tax=Metabacillus arenae TaxID=2771434 RepID=A0A926NGX8_9BACI|nr:SIMPL domain-containing protein [Metabacillus arenae]MBD1380875.1 SIMPL domain-containing protein [Metabacillus arenae]